MDVRPDEPMLMGYHQWLQDDGQWCYRTYTVLPDGSLRVDYHAPQYRREAEDCYDYSSTAITTTTVYAPGEWREESVPARSNFGTWCGCRAARVADGVLI